MPRKSTRFNDAERKFEELAARNGWETTKRGWPDFLAFGPNGDVIAVEVKPRLADGSRTKYLKREQTRVMTLLQQHGIKCYVSDGETLEPFNPKEPRG